MSLARGAWTVALLAGIAIGASCGGGETISEEEAGLQLAPASTCGNAQCEAGESPDNCPSDCWCGDGVCSSPYERPLNCETDCCGSCPAP